MIFTFWEPGCRNIPLSWYVCNLCDVRDRIGTFFVNTVTLKIYHIYCITSKKTSPIRGAWFVKIAMSENAASLFSEIVIRLQIKKQAANNFLNILTQ